MVAVAVIESQHVTTPSVAGSPATPLTGQAGPSRESLTGRAVLGDQRGSTLVDVDQVRLGRRGLTFRFPWSLETGKHAWVEVVLPTGKRIRPLVAVLSATEGTTAARFVHLFPEHQRALDTYLASASGY